MQKWPLFKQLICACNLVIKKKNPNERMWVFFLFGILLFFTVFFKV